MRPLLDNARTLDYARDADKSPIVGDGPSKRTSHIYPIGASLHIQLAGAWDITVQIDYGTGFSDLPGAVGLTAGDHAITLPQLVAQAMRVVVNVAGGDLDYLCQLSGLTVGDWE